VGNNARNEILFDVTQATSRTGGSQGQGQVKRGGKWVTLREMKFCLTSHRLLFVQAVVSRQGQGQVKRGGKWVTM